MKTFENSYNPNAENTYKNVESNTEQPKSDVVESIKEEQRLTALEKEAFMQARNEESELNKVDGKGTSSKFKKVAIMAMLGTTLFASAAHAGSFENSVSNSTGRATGQIIQQTGKGISNALCAGVERLLNGGMTLREEKEYNKKLDRIQKELSQDLKSRDAGVRARAQENCEIKKKELKEQYGIKE